MWVCHRLDCVSRFSSHYLYDILEFPSCEIQLTPQYNILFLLKPEKLTWDYVFLFFNGDLASECSYYFFSVEIYINNLKSIKFHENWFSQENLQTTFFFFARITFCEKTSFAYIARIKFTGFRKKDILPVVVTFCMRLKWTWPGLVRDLICTIQKFKIFTGIKYSEFCELAIYYWF